MKKPREGMEKGGGEEECEGGRETPGPAPSSKGFLSPPFFLRSSSSTASARRQFSLTTPTRKKKHIPT